jgi:hypothetical protein
MEKFGECRIMKFLSKKMTSFHLVVQPGRLVSGLGGHGRLSRCAIEMPVNLLFLEGPFEMDGKDNPVGAIHPKFGNQ